MRQTSPLSIYIREDTGVSSSSVAVVNGESGIQKYARSLGSLEGEVMYENIMNKSHIQCGGLGQILYRDVHVIEKSYTD